MSDTRQQTNIRCANCGDTLLRTAETRADATLCGYCAMIREVSRSLRREMQGEQRRQERGSGWLALVLLVVFILLAMYWTYVVSEVTR